MSIKTSRSLLLGFASTAALLTCPIMAVAQTAPQDDTSQVEEVIVTGTRTVGRTRLDTIAPVDVISGETLTRQGTGTETAAALAAAAPSINFPRPAISDGSDHVRPATLRGLAPDQTLVLINGQRGHVSALLNVNGAIGRGSTAFDLNTIPSVSLGTIEVLRDGASAQYGSDAIAGVINLRLREAREGGGLTLNYGRYDTEYETARGSHEATDGTQKSISGWVGLPLGEDGFLTVSGELQRRDPTNRSDYAAPTALPLAIRATPTVLGRYGDPEVDSQSLWFNAGTPIGSAGWSAYAFGGVQHKETKSGATARQFDHPNNVLAVYPNGYTPLIGTEIYDYNLFGGIKGAAAGIDWDLSVGYGRNVLDYRITNTINASYGAASLREFNAGGLEYDQLTVAVDGVRPIEVGLVQPLNVAFGVEYRREGFAQSAGQPESYNRGPIAAGVGSQGFGGFNPLNVVDRDRNNWSAYIDVEGNLTDALSFGVAGRYEDYSDFGDQFTGKISARYDFSEAFALRGAVSTGFRAPALQQQFFSYTSTNLQPGGALIQAGTFRVDDPIAIFLGARPLEAETSTNYSLGGVFRSGGFELTVDAYEIGIDDRIVYSENLGAARPSQTAASTTAISNLLLATYNVTAARFFLNGVDTTTRGVDVVGRYRLPSDYGRFDFTLAGNYNETTVDKIPAVPSLAGIAVQPFFLFDRTNILQFEEGTPKTKVLGSVDWSLNGWGVTAKATYYASVLQSATNNNPALDYETGSATLFDLEARYELPMGVGLAIGVNNLTDEYPQFAPAAINAPTGSVGYPLYAPYGFNGRFLYGRISYKF